MKVLVTGAAAGLGRALVERAIDRGASVVAVDRDAAGLAELDFLHPRQVSTRRLDLADTRAVEELTAELCRYFRFDRVFLNAGISATGRFEEIPGEAYASLVRVNAAAPMVMAAGFVRTGAVNKGGALVFVSSLSHATGYPGAAVYAATKDAIAAYAAAVRRPFRKRGVRVMTVFPGPIRTDHAERHAPEGANAAKRMSPEKLAAKVWRAAGSGPARLYPGLAAKSAGSAGHMMPRAMTRLMRKVIFEKLGRGVW